MDLYNGVMITKGGSVLSWKQGHKETRKCHLDEIPTSPPALNITAEAELMMIFSLLAADPWQTAASLRKHSVSRNVWRDECRNSFLVGPTSFSICPMTSKSGGQHIWMNVVVCIILGKQGGKLICVMTFNRWTQSLTAFRNVSFRCRQQWESESSPFCSYFLLYKCTCLLLQTCSTSMWLL